MNHAIFCKAILHGWYLFFFQNHRYFVKRYRVDITFDFSQKVLHTVNTSFETLISKHAESDIRRVFERKMLEKNEKFTFFTTFTTFLQNAPPN